MTERREKDETEKESQRSRQLESHDQRTLMNYLMVPVPVDELTPNQFMGKPASITDEHDWEKTCIYDDCRDP